MHETAQPLLDLCGEPVGIDVARRPPADGGVPATSGFYAWWLTDASALPSVPLPSQSPPWLLYVGIAPSRATSRATLRSRVLGQHIGGNLDASTFRRSLAALLWHEKGWTPYVTAKGKLQFDAEDNRALRSWQEHHLQLTWAMTSQPWSLEGDVIAALRPPLNVDHNSDHEFCAAMKAARADCVACAVPLGR